MVRSTVEETLNALLDAEADRLCGAGKHEGPAKRRDARTGSYDRKLRIKAGDVTLTVPKLRTLPFETAVIERYRRRERVAGRGHHISLVGDAGAASTVSDLNQKIYGKIEEWRQQRLVGDFPYMFLDGMWLKRSWGAERP